MGFTYIQAYSSLLDFDPNVFDNQKLHKFLDDTAPVTNDLILVFV